MLSRIRCSRLHVLLVACLLALGCLLAAPARLALADDYSVESVTIDATLQTDGSLVVQESRVFDFDGSFHGVYWEVPKGEYEGREIDAVISSVGELIGGQFVAFTEDYSGNNHTYQLTEYSDYVRVKLYSAHSNEDATFVINYTNTNLASRYDDISELYWEFVVEGGDVEFENVTCTVHLPVPDGKKVEPEENVRAWGHGPLDASVHFDGEDVIYTVPGVGTSEFAEARIVFPAEWLSDASSQGGRMLQSILEEEQAWADEANARRERARKLTYGGGIVGILATLASIIVSLVTVSRYRKSHKPHFDDKYWRDVPSDDHPAVLGAFWRDGSPSDEDFTATLMRLSDLGAVKLELVKTVSKGKFGRTKTKEDYRLTCDPKTADMQLDTVDRQTLLTLFDSIGRYAKPHEGDDPNADIIYFDDLEKIGKKHPEQFSAAYDGWEAVVKAQMSTRRLFKDDGSTGRGVAGACIAVMSFLIMGTIFFMMMTEAWALGLGLLLAEAIGLGVGIFAIAYCKPISEEGIEIKAKMDALRRWLKDFTRLEEAVPRDVVLWNRLLVMAVVLGVAEEVIKQLKMSVPELLDDSYLSRTYGWYYLGPRGRAISSFHNSYASAHSVSSAALAASERSSGGGGGGGFSFGGGGGFSGGGGRGGAF